jgi:hypothetical protein
MRDILGYAVAALIGLWTATLQPWSPQWWTGVIIAGTVALITSLHLLWSNLPTAARDAIRPIIWKPTGYLQPWIGVLLLAAILGGGYAGSHGHYLPPKAPISAPVPSQPAAPTAPVDQLTSTLGHMIYKCPLPADDSLLSTEERKARNDRFRKDIAIIGPALGAMITLTDLPNGVRFEVVPDSSPVALQWGAAQKLILDANRLSSAMLVTVDVQLLPPLDLISRLIHFPMEAEPAKANSEKTQKAILKLIERLFGTPADQCVMI